MKRTYWTERSAWRQGQSLLLGLLLAAALLRQGAGWLIGLL